MKIRSHHAARGYTIIELMVALFLLAIIVAAMYSSWIAIVRGSKTGLEAAAMVQRSRMAIRTLENALTCTRSFQADVDYYAFIAENGGDASLSFVARLPNAFPRSGKFPDYNIRRVTFSLEPGIEGNQLVLRQNPLMLDMDEDEKNYPVVLARNVKEFEMEFWDKKKQDWIDEWTETNQLPQKVKISLLFIGNPRSPMKEEVVRIISLPSVMVQPNWQMPGYNPGPIQNPRR